MCTIEDCSKTHHARGWCSKHYHRWLKWGNPLHVAERPWGRFDCRGAMDDWEKRRVARLLSQGMSCRAIERSTGVGYMTVNRFSRKLRETLAA